VIIRGGRELRADQYSPMPEQKYIWCRNCDEIHHVTPFDKAPAFTVVEGEIQESPVDDWHVFMQRHSSHMLEPLTPIGEKYFPCGHPFDPMNVGYIDVMKGKTKSLMRAFRKSVDEPLRFEFVQRPAGWGNNDGDDSY
jgi:hypothetical protein